jgi:hypothetical protein
MTKGEQQAQRLGGGEVGGHRGQRGGSMDELPAAKPRLGT